MLCDNALLLLPDCTYLCVSPPVSRVTAQGTLPGAQPTPAPVSCQGCGAPPPPRSGPADAPAKQDTQGPPGYSSCGAGHCVPAPDSAAKGAAAWDLLYADRAGCGREHDPDPACLVFVRVMLHTPPLGHGRPHTGGPLHSTYASWRDHTGHAAGAAAKIKGTRSQGLQGTHASSPHHSAVRTACETQPWRGCPTTTTTNTQCDLTPTLRTHMVQRSKSTGGLHIPFAPPHTGGYAGGAGVHHSRHTCTSVYRSTGHRRTPGVGMGGRGLPQTQGAPPHPVAPPHVAGCKGFRSTQPHSLTRGAVPRLHGSHAQRPVTTCCQAVKSPETPAQSAYFGVQPRPTQSREGCTGGLCLAGPAMPCETKDTTAWPRPMHQTQTGNLNMGSASGIDPPTPGAVVMHSKCVAISEQVLRFPCLLLVPCLLHGALAGAVMPPGHTPPHTPTCPLTPPTPLPMWLPPGHPDRHP